MAMATTRQTEQVAPKWFPHPNQEMREPIVESGHRIANSLVRLTSSSFFRGAELSSSAILACNRQLAAISLVSRRAWASASD